MSYTRCKLPNSRPDLEWGRFPFYPINLLPPGRPLEPADIAYS